MRNLVEILWNMKYMECKCRAYKYSCVMVSFFFFCRAGIPDEFLPESKRFRGPSAITAPPPPPAPSMPMGYPPMGGPIPGMGMMPPRPYGLPMPPPQGMYPAPFPHAPPPRMAFPPPPSGFPRPPPQFIPPHYLPPSPVASTAGEFVVPCRVVPPVVIDAEDTLSFLRSRCIYVCSSPKQRSRPRDSRPSSTPSATPFIRNSC
jgi:hypothetical protein